MAQASSPLAVAGLLVLLAGCGRGDVPAPGPLLSPFVHRIVDADPPGGRDCCTDVLAVGDLDGDGRPDLVIGSEHDPEIGLVWYRAPDWRRLPIAKGDFTTDATLADIDGDGRLDIVICDLGRERGLCWFRNPGQVGDWTRERIGDAYAHDVRVADLDGDGLLDVVACDKKRVMLFAHGSDSWSMQLLSSREGEGIDIADIDGDGRSDLCFGASWLRNPGEPGAAWAEFAVARGWPTSTRVVAADIDGDHRLDLVLSASEGPGRVSWFARTEDDRDARWTEHVVWDDDLVGVHSLRVCDVDLDGRPDIVCAEMHTSPHKRVAVLYQDAPDQWRPLVLSEEGSHNLVAVDLDGDGDIDLVGKQYASEGRRVETWENQLFAKRAFTALQIDRDRPDDQFGKMGIGFADLDGDRRTDVFAGGYAYLNPGGDLSGEWRRERLPGACDAHLAVDVDHDGDPDLLGFDQRALVWLERDRGGNWHESVLAQLQDGRTQGEAIGQLFGGGREEFVFTRGKRLFAVTLPDHPEQLPWDVRLLTSDIEEEGLALGDLDGDGDLDVFGEDIDGHETCCFLNPGGDGRGTWRKVPLGGSREWLDRLARVDLDGDGVAELVTTEETQDWSYDANVYVRFAPKAPDTAWTTLPIARLRSVNSMEVGDIDGDGHPDIVIAEHTDQRRADGAPDNITAVLFNGGDGRTWRTEYVDVGPRSSHLGARLCDLDGDGDLDIVSPAWRQFRELHLWRNDRPRR
ncbi:MAG: VCBS repeat-containing protein [Planctomycetota bacterium]